MKTVIMKTVLFATLCMAFAGCLSVVRIAVPEHSDYSDDGQCTNRVWTSFLTQMPEYRVYPTVKMRCKVTSGYFAPINPTLTGRDLYEARWKKRTLWLPLIIVWATAPLDAAVDTLFLPYDFWAKGKR